MMLRCVLCGESPDMKMRVTVYMQLRRMGEVIEERERTTRAALLR